MCQLTILLSLLFLFFTLSYTVTINTIAYYQNGAGETIGLMVDKFNNYASENNLDIDLNLVYFGKTNSSETFEFYESFIESHFKKEFDKYELIFLNDLTIGTFGEHLLDLSDFVSKDLRKLYSGKSYYEHCFYKDKWISLPIFLDLTVLYSNDFLLKKYNKSLPKTWDELIETSKYIIDEEQKLGNSIIGYNGLFYDGEGGVCSIYEFINSFRKSKDDGFPKADSEEFASALKMMKKIKEEVSNDEQFQKNEVNYEEYLYTNNYVFSKFWYIPDTVLNSDKKISLLPGRTSELSGSIVGSNGLGINKYVTDESKRKAATEIIKYFSSVEFQKEMVMAYQLPTGISSLYDDEEVCGKVDCEMFKGFQMIARPSARIENYEAYSQEFRKNVYGYLYGDNTIEDTIAKITESEKYYISSANSRVKNFSLYLFSVMLSFLLYIIAF
ncbi:periplasmic binding protein-like II [Piromyces finnis]|uniref:Periplasmic binding protein-like II n=1 Tax=Piromyces finnis TaxID=1754191 RepID=A0A1Y1VPA3_9FUNG|nr:periplasmic binding protein-like II [Piromyces finnis]|eukprot:ORX61247.1 periplasmic binding protein-like II [Piromyces finnis]